MINLEQEIVRENTATLVAEEAKLNEQTKLDLEVEKVLSKADAVYRQDLMAELGFDYKLAEAQKIKAERETFAALPQNRIMSDSAIRAVCIKYGLRFLPTRFYKGALDDGIGPKLADFKRAMGGSLPVIMEAEMLQYRTGQPENGNAGKPQMYIAAPSESFVLRPVPRDPLLFCRLNLNKFFLIHKWGRDLEKADVKNHHTTEGNWNSPIQIVEDRDYAGAMRQYMQVNGNAQWASSNQFNNPTVAWSGTTTSPNLWASFTTAGNSSQFLGITPTGF